MNRRALPPILLALAVAAAAGLALRADPASAQRSGEEPPPGETTTRYRLALVRVTLGPDADGAPLRLADLGPDARAAIAPAAEGPSAAGFFGAVPFPNALLEALRRRGKAEVLFRGETEGTRGRKLSLNGGKRFPVVTVDVRGGQLIASARFEKTGVELALTRREGDLHDLTLEFSAVSARSASGQPILFEARSVGPVLLPDGTTAVFSFFDRVEGEDLVKGAERWLGDGKAETPSAAAAHYFVLLTRMDLARR